MCACVCMRTRPGFILRVVSLSAVFNLRRGQNGVITGVAFAAFGASLLPLRRDSAESARRVTYFHSTIY